MILFFLVKTPEFSPELAYSEMDYQGLNVSPLPKVKASLTIEKKLAQTQENVIQYCFLYKYLKDVHNIYIF